MVSFNNLEALIGRHLEAVYDKINTDVVLLERWTDVDAFLQTEGYYVSLISNARFVISNIVLDNYYRIIIHQVGDLPSLDESMVDFSDRRVSLRSFQNSFESKLKLAVHACVHDRRFPVSWNQAREELIKHGGFTGRDMDTHRDFIIDCFFQCYSGCLQRSRLSRDVAPQDPPCPTSPDATCSTSTTSSCDVSMRFSKRRSVLEQEDDENGVALPVTVELAQTINSSRAQASLELKAVPCADPSQWWIKEKHVRNLLGLDPIMDLRTPCPKFLRLNLTVKEKRPFTFIVVPPEVGYEGDMGIPFYYFPPTPSGSELTVQAMNPDPVSDGTRPQSALPIAMSKHLVSQTRPFSEPSHDPERSGGKRDWHKLIGWMAKP